MLLLYYETSPISLWHLSNLDNNNNIIIKSYAAEYEIFRISSRQLKNCSEASLVVFSQLTTFHKLLKFVCLHLCVCVCVCNCAC